VKSLEEESKEKLLEVQSMYCFVVNHGLYQMLQPQHYPSAGGNFDKNFTNSS